MLAGGEQAEQLSRMDHEPHEPHERIPFHVIPAGATQWRRAGIYSSLAEKEIPDESASRLSGMTCLV